jgi:signal transduction histidine kinase
VSVSPLTKVSGTLYIALLLLRLFTAVFVFGIEGDVLIDNSNVHHTALAPRRRWVFWLGLFGIYTLPALIFAGLIHARMVQIGEESSFWEWLLGQQSAWYAWALLTPLIIHLGRRFRLDREHWLPNGLVHVVCGVVLAALQSAVAVLGSIAVHGEPMTLAYYWGELYPFWIWRGPWAFLVYWAIIGVSYAFDYHASLKERELHASRLESQLHRAQLDALRRQLQPHFLFNTLNSITVLMQKGETETASRMLSDLSTLLRHVLSTSDVQEVPLEEEVEFVRRYTEIEQARFGDRLRVSIDIDPSARHVPVPSFILQLLVENAILHGIAHKTEGGDVEISARCRDGRLNLQVRDNGVGIGGEEGTDGIGIGNARERLRHLYGSDFRLEVSDAPGGGVLAELDIPAVSEQAGD